jgi:peptidoglycan/xylan/chitin deacetylase (PgdA/CDA1 family)
MDRRRHVVVLLAAIFALAASARAKEQALVDLAAADAFAPQWPAGELHSGRDGKRHWLEVRTAGDTSPVMITNRTPWQPALDLRGRFLKVWIRVDDLEKLGGMEFRLSSGSLEEHFAFGFTRYADLDGNVVREGVWTVLTFPFASARVVGAPDRAAIRRIGWYVADQGHGPTIARWGGLAAVDEPAEGVVSFTFDDAYDEHYWAAEQMARHGMRATAYVIPNGIGKPGYLTEKQLAELRDRFRWEIAAHHETPFTDFAPADLEPRIDELQHWLTERGFARGARHLAYPLGRQEPRRVRPAVRRHFVSARVAGGGLETLPPANLQLLRVFNVLRSTTPEAVAAAARSAREDRHWLILMFHYLVDEPRQDIEYRRADFERLVQLVAETGVRVVPLIDVAESCGRPRRGGCRLPETRAAAPAR